MTAARQAVVVAGREVALELAGRAVTTSALPFVTVLVVLAGLGFGPRRDVLAATAPGLVWLIVLVAALPLATGVAAAERRDDCWDLLRALCRPAALLFGKAAAVWLWLLTCWALASVLAGALLAAPWRPVAVAGGLLGTLGVAASTVVLSVLLPDGSQRPGLLAVLLLPGATPALLAGTQVATVGVPAVPWLVLLAAYDAVTLTAAWAVFPTLLED